MVDLLDSESIRLAMSLDIEHVRMKGIYKRNVIIIRHPIKLQTTIFIHHVFNASSECIGYCIFKVNERKYVEITQVRLDLSDGMLSPAAQKYPYTSLFMFHRIA